MAVVLQASLGAAPSSAKDDSNVQLLKNRINELEQQTEELSRKYNEELKAERVDYFVNIFRGKVSGKLPSISRLI